MDRCKWLVFLTLFLLVPSAYAKIDVDISGAFEMTGEWLSDVFSNEYATFAVTIVVLTILLRSIFAASLKRTKIFEGSGGEGISRFGNAISWTLAILASIGLFYLKGDRDVGVFLERILGPAGIWVAVVIVIVIFMWLKGATGSAWIALLLTGLISMVIAGMVQFPMLGTAGVFMLILGGIMTAFNLAGRRSRAARRTYPDIRREEDATEDLARHARRTRPTDQRTELDEQSEEDLERGTGREEARRDGFEGMIQHILDSPTRENLHDLRRYLEHVYRITDYLTKNERKVESLSEEIEELQDKLERSEIRKLRDVKEKHAKLQADNKELAQEQRNLYNAVMGLEKEINDSRRDLIKHAEKIREAEQRKVRRDRSIMRLIEKQLAALDGAESNPSQLQEYLNEMREDEETKRALIEENKSDAVEIRDWTADKRKKLRKIRADERRLSGIADKFLREEEKEEQEVVT